MIQGNNHRHKISLVFPVYQEKEVYPILNRIALDLQKHHLDWEALAIYDTRFKKKASRLKLNALPQVKILFYPLSRLGKGFAFCYGFNQSTSNRIFFWEGDFSISVKQLILYLDLMDLVKADIVIGSKQHPLSKVYYSSFRRQFSKAYQLLVKLLFGLNLTDTRVGLKLYRRAVLEKVIPKIIIKNWAFDLEILVVAHQLGFRRIIEAPIEIRKHFAKRSITWDHIRIALSDTLSIFYRNTLLKYYRQKFT